MGDRNQRRPWGCAVEHRIVELEVRVAFQEKLISDLDEVVRGLRDEVESLKALLEALQEDGGRQKVDDAPPPHW